MDANTTLGFDDDEREYSVAVRMLQMLGCARVVLLTNNPAELDGLAKAGIEITGRMPLETPINADNRRYMTAKAARAGHQLGHLMSVLAEARRERRESAAARALNAGAAPRRWIRGRRCPCSATAAEAPGYTATARALHWTTAALVVCHDSDRDRDGQLQLGAGR